MYYRSVEAAAGCCGRFLLAPPAVRPLTALLPDGGVKLTNSWALVRSQSEQRWTLQVGWRCIQTEGEAQQRGSIMWPTRLMSRDHLLGVFLHHTAWQVKNISSVNCCLAKLFWDSRLKQAVLFWKTPWIRGADCCSLPVWHRSALCSCCGSTSGIIWNVLHGSWFMFDWRSSINS